MQANALEALLSESSERIERHIRINARSLGQRNLPSPTGDLASVYFEPYHGEWQILIYRLNAELQFQATCHRAIAEERNAEERFRELTNEADELEEYGIALEASLRALPSPPSGARPALVRAAVAGVTLFEGMMSIPVFEAWGFSLGESVVLGVLFSAVLAAFAHMARKIVMAGKTPLQRKGVAGGILAAMTAIFTYMALARSEHLSAEAAAGGSGPAVHFSPIPFVLMSLLLFVVAVGLCVFYMPDDRQRELASETKALARKLRETNEAARAKREQAAAVKEGLARLKEECASVLVRGCMLEGLAISSARNGFALWKRHNLLHRQDALRPDCFTEQYPFAFTTFFQSVKPLGNENT